MSGPAEVAHEHLVRRRRVAVLCRHLAEVLPPDCSVLDVGAGDGMLTGAIGQARPDTRLEGVDSHLRETTYAPVKSYDGQHLPYPDDSFDVVLFVDVLHHTADPMVLLREARRVARRALVVKDHSLLGLGARATLRFMDTVGNRRFGVDLPHNYWTPGEWDAALAELGLVREEWRTRLGLYPRWCDWLFGRRLHFVARLGLSGLPREA